MSDRELARKRAREWLDENRPRFQELRPKLEDATSLLALLNGLFVYLEPILSITAESEPHSAMFAIGQTKAGVEDVYRDIAFYYDYKNKQRELENLIHDEGEPGREHAANPDGSVDMAVT